jgi:hypothetical protein
VTAGRARRPPGGRPFLCDELVELRCLRSEEGRTDEERDTPSQQAEQRPEVVVAPLAFVHEDYAHHEHDERRGYEDARARPLGLTPDADQFVVVSRAVCAKREHGD